jgi:hypothetical protein
VQWLLAMYSNSVVDNAMVGCFLHFYEVIPTQTKNMYLVICISRPICIPKSSQGIILHPRYYLKSKILFKYLMMHFTVIQYAIPTFGMNWVIVFTTNKMSALTAIIAYM